MGKTMICPNCEQEVEVTKIRTNDKSIFKYISFTKAVGVCPNCLSEIHIPEIDEMVEALQVINKDYVNILNEFVDSSELSRDTDFSKDWDIIDSEELAFETSKMGIVKKLVYNGTLKTSFGYDIITMDSKFNDKLDEIRQSILDEEVDDETIKSYYFKTYVLIGGSLKEVCCMMWEDIEGDVSGIIFNKSDTSSYRYGKQKAKDKAVIV